MYYTSMQLFVTQPSIEWDKMILREERVIKYMWRVLRMKKWQSCMIQWQIGNEVSRWEVILIAVSKKEIQADIINCKKNVNYLSNIELIVCLPNTISKLELIVQKCTEIGVDTIYFWRSERSLMKWISEKRMERLWSIVLESVEQCKRRWTTKLVQIENPIDFLTDKNVVVFDFVDNDVSSKSNVLANETTIWIVWPEGHFGEKDYHLLKAVSYVSVSLWSTVLRTETAAIVWAWYLCNKLD